MDKKWFHYKTTPDEVKKTSGCAGQKFLQTI